jgi:hypothetical protein
MCVFVFFAVYDGVLQWQLVGHVGRGASTISRDVQYSRGRERVQVPPWMEGNAVSSRQCGVK